MILKCKGRRVWLPYDKQMKKGNFINKIKSEKGSITTVVTVTIIFFLTILSSAYMISSIERKAQLKSQLTTRQTYEEEFDNVDPIYREYKNYINTTT